VLLWFGAGEWLCQMTKRQLVEGNAQPESFRYVSGNVVVAASQILHEGMTGCERSR
jgi:hypothetical protein